MNLRFRNKKRILKISLNDHGFFNFQAKGTQEDVQNLIAFLLKISQLGSGIFEK